MLSPVWLFVIPGTVARQASLSFTISQSLLSPMSAESVMPSSHPAILCHPLLLPSIFPASGSIILQKTLMCHDILNHNICLSHTSYWWNCTGCDLLCLTFTKHDAVQILLCFFVSQERVLQSRCPLFQFVYLFTSLRRFCLFPSFWRLNKFTLNIGLRFLWENSSPL